VNRFDPPADVAAVAREAAQRAVFKEPGGKIVQTLIAAKRDHPWLDFVIPFVKTPANILRQGIEASPLAPLSRQFRDAVSAGGRAQSEAMGRATSGTVALATLAYWASQGRLSGNGPSAPSQRAALMEAGWRPNAVKVGDQWVDCQRSFRIPQLWSSKIPHPLPSA
jgi:hypothetical protein